MSLISQSIIYSLNQDKYKTYNLVKFGKIGPFSTADIGC